jgi:hypothetical protein
MDYESRPAFNYRYKNIGVFLRAGNAAAARHNKRMPLQSPIGYPIYSDLALRLHRESLNGTKRKELIARATRKGLHSNTFLHTWEPFNPEPHHESRTCILWRDGRGKLESHMALHLTHLKCKAFGCYIVLPSGDIVIYYHVGYNFSSNKERHTNTVSTSFSYCVLTASRGFNIDPGHSLSDTESTWLYNFAQRLPRDLAKRRPGLEVNQCFFDAKRHIELAAFGVVTVVPAIEAEAGPTEQEDEAENTHAGGTNNSDGPSVTNDNDDGDERKRKRSGNRALLPAWFWPMVSALESSPDPAADAALQSLHADHRDRGLQKQCAKLITAGRYHTPPGAISYISGAPRIQDSAPVPGSSSYVLPVRSAQLHHPPSPTVPDPGGTVIADDEYDVIRAARQAKIARRTAQRSERRLAERQLQAQSS